MSIETSSQVLIERFLTLFGDPKTTDVRGFLTEYAKALQGYTKAELQAAADELIGHQEYRSWPTIAECKKACDRVRRSLSSSGGIPMADVGGTGWRISSSSGKKWFRIERGSREFDAWMRFYRDNGKRQFAAFLEHYGHSFVLGPSPIEHGGDMLAYLEANAPRRAA